MISKTWYKNYPGNVSREIDSSKYNSLLDLFNDSVTKYKDKVAFIDNGEELSFNQVDQLSNHFAAYLQQALEIKKGDRIALMCPNTLPFIIAMWGIIKAGAVQVNVNPLYKANELKHQLNDSKTETIVIIDSSLPVYKEIIDDTPIKKVIRCKLVGNNFNKVTAFESNNRILVDSIDFNEALAQGEQLVFSAPNINQTDLLFLQYTGGTTGLSKGAMLSHGNILANITQFNEIGKNHFIFGKEIIITILPLYHIYGLTVNALSYFSFGATNILINNQDLPAIVKIWSKFKVTTITGVNTLFNGLMHTDGFEELDFSSLSVSIGGGAKIQQSISNQWEHITECVLHEGYGLSESSAILTLNFKKDSHSTLGIGIPLPSTDIVIRDDHNNDLPVGEEGELCAKGPQIMSGYWNNTEATLDTMTVDGYFKTGDIAILDRNGFFHIVDRKKDMILVSGFNVFPNEIEAIVAQMPEILECACVGVESEKTGEKVKLFAVKANAEISAENIKTFCREHLANYKVPKEIEFVTALPKSAVGKILRRELRG